jgi:hypothetical protein
LTHKHHTEQLFRLPPIQVEVKDAPLYLLGSQFCHPDVGVAGEEIQLQILPVDVFGCPLHAGSTTDYNLNEIIKDSLADVDDTKEWMDFKVIKEESNIKIHVSILLINAGSRKLMIFDSNKNLQIHIRPNLSYVHFKLTTPKATALTGEDLTLTPLVFDRFDNEIQIGALQSIPDLVVKDGADGLVCTSKPGENSQVTFGCHFKRSGKYDLCLITEDGNSFESTPMSITVTEAPVDYKLSSVTWLPQYDDIQDQPVFAEDESFQCCLKLKDIFNNDHEGSIPTERIQIEYNKTRVKNLNVSSCANETGCYKIVVPLKSLTHHEPNPTFWCIVNGIRVEKPLVLATFTEFKEYNEKRNCKLEDLNIVCRGVTVRDITKNESYYLENIRRVCELKRVPEVHGFPDFTCIRLSSDDTEYKSRDGKKIRCGPQEIKSKAEKCRKSLLHFLRAAYYREAAFDLDEKREEWKARAIENYKIGRVGEFCGKERARFCSEIKEKYAAVMKAYHKAACEQYFLFFNAERRQSEIDLHGLLVVNEEKLNEHEKDLLSYNRYSAEEVRKIIEEERDDGNEAVRYVTAIS